MHLNFQLTASRCISTRIPQEQSFGPLYQEFFCPALYLCIYHLNYSAWNFWVVPDRKEDGNVDKYIFFIKSLPKKMKSIACLLFGLNFSSYINLSLFSVTYKLCSHDFRSILWFWILMFLLKFLSFRRPSILQYILFCALPSLTIILVAVQTRVRPSYTWETNIQMEFSLNVLT